MESASSTGGRWYANRNGIPTRHKPPPAKGRTTTTEVLALTDDQRLQMGAVHESGHAALWHQLGVQLKEVWIRTVAEANDAGEEQGGGTTVGADAEITLVDALVVAAAGERAVDRWLHETGLWTEERAWVVEQHATHDRVHAFYAVKDNDPDGGYVTFGQRDGHSYDYTTIQADADTRLDGLWDGVNRLAEALVEHRRVDGDEVPALVDGATTPVGGGASTRRRWRERLGIRRR